jgi:putative tricarboxylic transport membrane protein
MTVQTDGSQSDRPVVHSRSVDIAVSLSLLALAMVLGWDAHRIGASWADDGPQAGYFPFYLALILGASSLYGLVTVLLDPSRAPFVTREQITRVLQVFVPTLVFCALMQVLGLYVASFLLIAGFMWWIGGIAIWKSLVTSFLFTAAMFLTFEVAFNVIMPKGPLEAVFGY